MSEDLDRIDTPKRGPLTPEQLQRKQKAFLKAFRESANIMFSCQKANITRQTFYNWQEQDTEFRALVKEARLDASDVLEQAAYERAVKGVPSYVVSQGRLVIGPDGEPLIERKYSDGLLTTLLKANMPDKYKERAQVDMYTQMAQQAEQDKQELLADLATQIEDEHGDATEQGESSTVTT